MSGAGPLPEATGLPQTGLSSRRQASIAWTRQARGVFRASVEGQLRPGELRARAGWILAVQAGAVLAALVALAQAPPRLGPEWPLLLLAFTCLTLVVLHLRRLGGVTTDVLRDVDQNVLDTLEASPLASSAYIAGKSAFYLLEQVFGLLLLLPAWAACYLLRAVDLTDLLAVSLALAVSTLAFSASGIGRVLRVHGRHERGVAIPPQRRPAATAYAALGILMTGISLGVLAGYRASGIQWAGPVLVVLGLNPVLPLIAAVEDAIAVTLFGRSLPLWVLACGLLAAYLPAALAAAALRWKPSGRATGGLVLVTTFGLATLPVVVAAGATTGSVRAHAWLMVVCAGLAAVALSSWCGAGELSTVGERPSVPRLRGPALRRDRAALVGSLHLAAVLAVLATLAPSSGSAPPAWAWHLAALLLATSLLPTLLTATGARLLSPGRGSVAAVVLVHGLAAALVWLLPTLVQLVGEIPVLAPMAEPLRGPLGVACAASPLALLPECAAHVLGDTTFHAPWLDPPAPFGLPPWAVGLGVQLAVGVPLLAALLWLARLRARRRAR